MVTSINVSWSLKRPAATSSFSDCLLHVLSSTGRGIPSVVSATELRWSVGSKTLSIDDPGGSDGLKIGDAPVPGDLDSVRGRISASINVDGPIGFDELEMSDELLGTIGIAVILEATSTSNLDFSSDLAAGSASVNTATPVWVTSVFSICEDAATSAVDKS